jgi:hypothetical protein
MTEDRSIADLIHTARTRVDRRTFIQDVTEPLTGEVDRRKIAAKFNNLEHAIDELGEAVERIEHRTT